MSSGNPYDRYTWSGTYYKMRESLEQQGYDVRWIKVTRPGIIPQLIALIYKLYAALLHKKISEVFLKVLVPFYRFEPELQDFEKFDVIFAPCCGPYLNKINIQIPIIYMSDASPAALFGYYSKNVAKYNMRQANEMEKIALDKCAAIIYGSEWAKQVCMDAYLQREDKIYVLELGANIDDRDINAVIAKKKIKDYDGLLNILFLGVDWERKGGEIAVETTRILNEYGINSKIHIIGIRECPESCKDKPYVNYVGFLDKNKPDEYDSFISYLALADIHLLPTKAECAGVVFCESASCYIPSFTFLTGGTGNYVIDGKNGYKLPLNSTPDEFASLIEGIIKRGELKSLKISSRILYENKLNWTVWGKKINTIIKDLLKIRQ